MKDGKQLLGNKDLALTTSAESETMMFDNFIYLLYV